MFFNSDSKEACSAYAELNSSMSEIKQDVLDHKAITPETISNLIESFNRLDDASGGKYKHKIKMIVNIVIKLSMKNIPLVLWLKFNEAVIPLLLLIKDKYNCNH